VTRKDRPPGGNSWGPEDTRRGGSGSFVMVAQAAGDRRFGEPSSYSLTHAELAAEIRRRRREGWQGWEINARFTFGAAA
jgi:hypothetical protein